MAGSTAEERIRVKVEAALRKRLPGARIVHELVVGSCRADVAAIGEDDLILVEIKSERDTLARLAKQLETFIGVGCEVWLVVAEKWEAEIARLSKYTTGELVPHPKIKGGLQSVPNPDYVPSLCRVWRGVERGDHIELPMRYRRDPLLDTQAALRLLWAAELRSITGLGQRANIDTLVRHAHEHMTGREVRRAVCAALRSRPFPRADQGLVAA